MPSRTPRKPASRKKPAPVRRFVGSSGEDWCVRPAMLGPPDNVRGDVMQWLIVPGPPMSCYLAYVMPMEDPTHHTFFHMHPSTWSIHVVLSGGGEHHIEGKGHRIGPGTVIYQGPRVRHSIFPDPGQHLMHLSIQHPAPGWTKKAWVPCPEAGVANRFGDRAEYERLFGKTVDELFARLPGSIFMGPRWREYVAQPKRGRR
jgi:mannose-6-phosphate isomerase-like protein (cupin superfamily)